MWITFDKVRIQYGRDLDEAWVDIIEWVIHLFCLKVFDKDVNLSPSSLHFSDKTMCGLITQWSGWNTAI